MNARSRRAIVTGAQGFSGRALCQRLAAAGVEVHGIARRSSDLDNMSVLSDVSTAGLVAVVDRVHPDYVFHLAGAAPTEATRTIYDTNVGYAASLLQALDESGCRDCSVLFVGSAAEYGGVDAAHLPISEKQAARPYNYYGASKLAQTELALTAARRGLRIIVARPFNIIGPGMPAHIALQSFVRQAAEIAHGRQPPILRVGNLHAARDFVDVDDVAEAYCALIASGGWGEIVNVCSGRAVKIAEVLDRLLRIAGIAPQIRVDDARLKSVDVPVHCGSHEKLVRLTGKAPSTPLDETLQRVWRHAVETYR